MQQLTPGQLKELMGEQQDRCLSMFLPTERKSVETRQNPIRFKNILTRAEQLLVDDGLSERSAQEFLRPARDLLDDHEFWQQQGDGLAIFLSPGRLREFRLPATLEEDVFVGSRFYIKPLLAGALDRYHFYVLVLSQNETRLLECTRHTAHQLEVEDMPESLAAALSYVEAERQVQFHTGTAGAAGQRSAVFHGRTEDKKVRILEYFRKIDESLHPLLAEEHSPLVLAGVESNFPIYRQATSYPSVIEGVTGNLESLRPLEIHARTWEIVASLFRKKQEEALERLSGLLGTGHASVEPYEVVPGACNGRVDTLFLARGAHLWGRYDPSRSEVTTNHDRADHDEELLDLSAVQTLLHRGRVYTVQPETIPDGAVLAAIFRY